MVCLFEVCEVEVRSIKGGENVGWGVGCGCGGEEEDGGWYMGLL